MLLVIFTSICLHLCNTLLQLVATSTYVTLQWYQTYVSH